MKLILVALTLVATAVVALPVDDKVPQIVRSEFEHKPEGGYNFNYETENGISVQENGEVKEAVDEENKPHQVVVVRGNYAYTDPEGKPQQISYYADETGFHAEGESIPKAVSQK